MSRTDANQVADLNTRVGLFATFLIIHLSSAFVGSILFALQPTIVAVIYLATLGPVMLTAFASGTHLSLLRLLAIGMLIFIPLCIGYFLNPYSLETLGRVLIVFLVFSLGWICMNAHASAAINKALLISGAAGLLCIALLLQREGLTAYLENNARLTGGDESHPNFIGLNMVCVALVSALHRRWFVRYGALALAAFIANIVQSRNAILALGFIFAFQMWHDVIKHLRIRTALFLVSLFLFMAIYNYDAIEEGFIELFRLDDPYRGTGSDLVGRSELWRATWNLFLRHPLFGFGIGQHTIGANIDMYAHNMYLIILSESGLVGFLVYVGASICAVVGISQMRREEPASNRLPLVLLMIILVYYVFGVFEGRAVNVGNYLSYLFFFSLGYGIATNAQGQER